MYVKIWIKQNLLTILVHNLFNLHYIDRLVFVVIVAVVVVVVIVVVVAVVVVVTYIIVCFFLNI